MKFFLLSLSLCFMLACPLVKAQNIAGPVYNTLDIHALNAPPQEAVSVERLTKYLIRPALHDSDRVRLIFVWIAHNVAYDTETFFKAGDNYFEMMDLKRPDRVLGRRKAVCEGYASLFTKMCQIAGIKAATITGYNKGYTFQATGQLNADHVWNAVLVGGQWQLLDVTWASGYVNKNGRFMPRFDEKYLNVNPSFFIQDHLPEDPMWQMLNKPLSKAAFIAPAKEQQNDKNTPTFCYQDTLAKHFALDSMGRLQASWQRVLRFDKTNEYAKFKLARLAYNRAFDSLDVYQKELKTATATGHYDFQRLEALIANMDGDMAAALSYFMAIDRANTLRAKGSDFEGSIILFRNNLKSQKQALKKLRKLS